MVKKFTFKVHPVASPRLERTHHPLLALQSRQRPVDRATSVSFILSAAPAVHSLVLQFNPSVPIEEVATPPSSWYTDPSFLDRVFHRGWQVVGHTDRIKSPQDFFTGRLGKVECVVCLDDDGTECAFHNVCRHHASLLASGSNPGREYIIKCNWKLHDKVSRQRCEGGPVDGDNGFDRLGKKATYAFIYPNFMINRYGPWMDTNLVLPLTFRKCFVIFDYFLEGPLQGAEPRRIVKMTNLSRILKNAISLV